MLSGHIQGRILSMLSHMINPKTILEIGTYTGYSALCFAEGLTENGKIHTIDINEELAMTSSSLRSGVYILHINNGIGSQALRFIKVD